VTFAGVSAFSGLRGGDIASINYFGTVELLEGLRPHLDHGSAAVAISSNSATTTPGIEVRLVDACIAGDESAAREIAEETGPAGAYAASKLAVARWVRRQAPTEDWIGMGVRLNAIAPGYIATPMTDAMRADDASRRLLERVPLPVGRPGRPEEVAALVRFLLEPTGAFFVGSVLLFDGGTEALVRPDDWPVARPVRS
jgi:NAD(P)-dependent dehydrogenase (short-subunit alcohol dehydrogenase family)